MSATIYSSITNFGFSIRNPERIRENEINLTYKLSKLDFDAIIQRILIDFCNIKVLGYDKLEDKYWCKKYEKASCLLYIKIQIHFISQDCSKISILPIIGKKDDINMFVYDFNDAVIMYKTSNFIKNLLVKY
jgi:hypothetical protein